MKSNKKTLTNWTAIALCLLPSIPVETEDFSPKNSNTYSAETATESAKTVMTPVFAASTDAAKLDPEQPATRAFKLNLPAHFMRSKPAFDATPEAPALYTTAAFQSYKLPPGLSERMVPVLKPGSELAVRLQPTTRAGTVNPQQIAARYAAPKTAAVIAARLQRKPVVHAKNGKESFEEMEVVSNEELSDIRGGFLTSSGMILDLGLTTQTLVNGNTVQQTVLSPEALKNVDPATLRTLVRVTEGGASAEPLTTSDVPEIVNVIQNEANNVKIDQITSLNIDVQNVQQFKLQIQAPGLDYGTVINMR